MNTKRAPSRLANSNASVMRRSTALTGRTVQTGAPPVDVPSVTAWRGLTSERVTTTSSGSAPATWNP